MLYVHLTAARQAKLRFIEVTPGLPKTPQVMCHLDHPCLFWTPLIKVALHSRCHRGKLGVTSINLNFACLAAVKCTQSVIGPLIVTP